jgi:hypothetical protein
LYCVEHAGHKKTMNNYIQNMSTILNTITYHFTIYW